MSDTPLIRSLRAAVAATPDDVPLRLHLAELLLAEDDTAGAVAEAAAALQREPASEQARILMRRALDGTARPTPAAPPAQRNDSRQADSQPVAPQHPDAPQAGPQFPDSQQSGQQIGPQQIGPHPTGPQQSGSHSAGPRRPEGEPSIDGFDWDAAARDLGDIVPPMFVDGDETVDEPAYDLSESTVRLADVGGMTEVKQRIEAAFLAPMRNPELRALYGKSLRGGLLLYGPPGCGKTFIAKAVAGELGARFYAVTLADVLDMYIGQSERNLREVFQVARRNQPCVLFLDEVDAIGHRRAQLRNNAMRGAVNQLLGELDGVSADNDGVFVLAATNSPWDVDLALRRPGRFDRTVLVLPPDQEAREAILRYHLRGRPIAGIDVRVLARRTEGFSGADLAHVCETAAERALMASAAAGEVRMIGMADLLAARDEVRPSTGAWLETARNVAQFANESGEYDDLLAYLKRRKLM